MMGLPVYIFAEVPPCGAGLERSDFGNGAFDVFFRQGVAVGFAAVLVPE